MSEAATVHASAVKVGERAVVIRGPSGSGKSRLAFDLIMGGRSGLIPTAVLVGDDRVRFDTADGQLHVHAVPSLAGLIEIRGLGIRRCGFVEHATVGLIVDLAADDAGRLPSPTALEISILGVKIPRIPVGSGYLPLPLVVAALTTACGLRSLNEEADCLKGIGNHISPTLATD